MSLMTKLPVITSVPLLVSALVCALFCAPCAPLLAQTAAETFAKAKRTEINQAQAKQALPLYELVAQSPKATDTLKARALYRLSICYLKLEEYKKASETLTRLETSYPRSDQAVQARLLRKTLGASEKALAPRRNLEFEIQELLVAPTKAPTRPAMINATSASLISLQFIGPDGNVVLRKALDHSNHLIQWVAIAALVTNGDASAFDYLIKKSDANNFLIRLSFIQRSYASMLVQLCQKVPALWPRFRDAYGSSRGSSKARLLAALKEAGRLDLAPDYADFLTDKNALLRDAAWKIFEAARDREDPAACQAYVERLLKLLKEHPEFRDSMAARLVNAHDLAKVAGNPVEARWSEVLLKAAKEGVRGVGMDIANALRKTEDLRIPLRRALLNMSSSRHFGNALAYRWADPKEAGADTRKDARVARRLMDLAFAEFEAAWPSMPELATQLLNESWQLSTHLDLQSWKGHVGRLTDKVLLQGLSGFKPDNTRRSFVNAYYALFHSGSDRDWLQARIPWILATGRAADHPLVRYAVFQFIRQAFSQGCSLTSEQMAALKPMVFRSQDEDVGGSYFEGRARSAAMDLLHSLLGRKGGLTLEEALTSLQFTEHNRNTWNITPVLTRVHEAGRLEEAVQQSAQNASIPVCNIIRCVADHRLSASTKSFALRTVWSRADGRERVQILQWLPVLDENLAFIQKRFMDPDRTEWEHSLMAWIRRYRGKERVSLYLRALHLKDKVLKVQACQALQSLADPKAAPGLIDLLTYPDTEVREAAEKALEAIKNIDKNQQAWRDWYEALKKKGASK